MNKSSGHVVVASLRGFSKTFAGRRVLSDVDLDVFGGEVHGLLGQNGSGKSTLIKILAGFYQPDEGASLEVDGGIAFVHQDLGLVRDGTVLENLYVGRYETRLGWRIPWSHARRRASAALARFGLSINPDAKVGSLKEVDQTLVAIVRAFEQLKGFDHGLLVLDEPTASLPRDSVGRLFDAVRDFAAAGFGVLFVSHRIEEIQAITDRVSILREGALVDTASTANLDESELITRILGFEMDGLYPTLSDPQDERVLSVRELTGATISDVSFDLHRGEVIGVTGLRGMGYEEIPYLLFGEGAPAKGTITIDNQELSVLGLSAHTAIRAGLALLPANRLRDGGSAVASVSENITLVTLGTYYQGGLLRRTIENSRVKDLLETFRVQPPEGDHALGTLSGGNQQKALLAKWFESRPTVFLLHEPTQGVDIGARRQIFNQIAAAAKEGMSFILASSEYEDLAHLCDRVLVFRDGRLVNSLQGDSLSYERIVEQCFRELAATPTAVVNAV